MIDWNKPIETIDGNEAFVCKIYSDKKALVTYIKNGQFETAVFENDEWFIRNDFDVIKIKTDKLVGVYHNGSIELRKTKKPLSYCKAIIPLAELLSGKFKDGIPKGYGLED